MMVNGENRNSNYRMSADDEVLNVSITYLDSLLTFILPFLLVSTDKEIYTATVVTKSRVDARHLQHANHEAYLKEKAKRREDADGLERGTLHGARQHAIEYDDISKPVGCECGHGRWPIEPEQRL